MKVVLLNVFLYALAYQIQSPLLPFLVQSLGANDNSFDAKVAASREFAKLQSFFSFVQLIGGVVSGPFLDIFGSKALLVASNVSSALCYCLTASATSDFQLIVSRVPTLLQHGVLASRGMVSEGGHDSERAAKLGYIMVAYGIGATLGPSIGGKLGVVLGLRATAWISTFIAIASVALCAIALPNKHVSQYPSSPSAADKRGHDVPKEDKSFASRFLRVLKLGSVRMMLIRMIPAALASRILQAMLPIIIKDQYSGTSEDLGYLMTYSGLIMAVVQGVVIKPVVQKFSGQTIILYSAFLLVLSSLAFAMCVRLYEFYMVLLPLLVGASLFSTVNSAELSNAVDRQDTGTVLALDMGLGSGVGIIAPDIGMFILGKLDNFWLGVISAIIFLVSAVLSCFATAKPANKPHSAYELVSVADRDGDFKEE